MFSKGRVFSRPVVIGLVLIIGGLVVGLLGSRVAQAYSTGISGHSGNPGTNGGMTCNACHGGGQVPVVTLTGPASVTPGSTHTYVLAVQSTNPSVQTYAGLDVSATAGNLATSGADTQVMDGEITHTQPKANNASGVASFQFQWTAPTLPGSVTLYGAGNSVELNGYPGGDNPGLASLVVTVESPTAVTLGELSARPAAPGQTAVPASGLMLVLAGALALTAAVTARQRAQAKGR